MIKVNVDDLRLAGLRFYDEEHNGVEIGDNLSYAILVKKGDSYFNPFDLTEDYPVLERLPYSNTTMDGDDYGSMMRLVYGDTATGPCYVLTDVDFKDIYKSESTTLEEVGKYIIDSSYYFKDRENVLTYFNTKKDKSRIKKIRVFDKKNKENMDSFFEERGVTLQKHI